MYTVSHKAQATNYNLDFQIICQVANFSKSQEATRVATQGRLLKFLFSTAAV